MFVVFGKFARKRFKNTKTKIFYLHTLLLDYSFFKKYNHNDSSNRASKYTLTKPTTTVHSSSHSLIIILHNLFNLFLSFLPLSEIQILKAKFDTIEMLDNNEERNTSSSKLASTSRNNLSNSTLVNESAGECCSESAEDDNVIMPSNLTITSENKRREQVKSAALSAVTILIYYFFSICLTFYNRHLFVTYRYPLSITLIHLIFKFTSATLVRVALNHTRNRQNKRITLDWYAYLTRILPTAVASAADIGLSNWSLEYITITLYTMSKSTVILFIFLFSIVFKLEPWVSLFDLK
jgi:hypothetical protein